MSNHKAVVAEITEIIPIPGADRIVEAKVLGTSVVVGLDSKVGDIGIYFNSDLQLSHEFCHNNNLYSIPDMNKDKTKKGYFGRQRRVKAQKFKSVKSDGFFCPLSFADFITFSYGQAEVYLKKGEEFDALINYLGNSTPICNKYVTPATQKAQVNRERQPKKAIVSFPKHVETDNFFKEINSIPDGSILYITEKLYGTSGRFGYVEEIITNKWWQKALRFIGIHSTIHKLEHQLGTRNVVLGKGKPSFYGNEGFRYKAVEHLEGRLHPGEVIYFELVGFQTNNVPIMPPYTDDNKDKVHYSYGCGPGICKLFVYRIIKTDIEGNYVEYSWPQVRRRCEELELAMVPEIAEAAIQLPYLYQSKDFSELLEYEVNEVIEGNSTLDSHIREGVVIRVEPPIGKPYWLKAKSYSFKVKEGMIKEQEDYVDMEEIS